MSQAVVARARQTKMASHGIAFRNVLVVARCIRFHAPIDNQGSAQILDDWCANRSPLGDVESWMKANDCRSGHNACAIRRMDGAPIEYHYFMKRARLYWSRHIDTIQQGE